MVLLNSIVDYVRNYSYGEEMEITLFDADKETNVYLLVDIKFKNITYNISLYNQNGEIYWTISQQKQSRTIRRVLKNCNDYDYLISLIQKRLI